MDDVPVLHDAVSTRSDPQLDEESCAILHVVTSQDGAPSAQTRGVGTLVDVDFHTEPEDVVLSNFDAHYEERRLRLAEMELAAKETRISLAQKEEEIRALREELGLTALAKFKQTVTKSAAVQKTKDIGGRVVNSDAFKKTQSAFADAGNRTGSLLKSAGAKSSQGIGETKAVSGISTRLRWTSLKLKSTFSRETVGPADVPIANENESEPLRIATSTKEPDAEPEE